MIEKELTITGSAGLHARPAAMFVQAAAKFKETSIKLAKEGKEVDAKSILSVLSLGAKQGSTITIRAEGPQESEAIDALTTLVQGGFGEH